MKTVIDMLCFLFVIFPNPAESLKRHKEAAVHPLPIEVNNVYHFQGYVTSAPIQLTARFRDVAIDEDHKYIIGAMMVGYLFPFMARRADLNNRFGRVKILISGNHANVTVPIFEKDPLNSLFHQQFESAQIHAAHIRIRSAHIRYPNEEFYLQ